MKKDPRTLEGYDVGIIPEEHQFAHTLCFFLHDLVLQTLKEGEKADVFNIHIEGDEAKLAAIKGCSGEDLVAWLEANGHKADVYILTFKQVFRAMLSDYCHFLYEALDCSAKGKLSVTFALLRKPFKEHLSYFEWLLGDPTDFLEIFHHGEAPQLALDRNPEKVRINIAKAMEKLQPYWGTSDLIYDIRFNKSSDIGFEGMLQHANHLVTVFKEYRTSPKNFNFIFSTGETMEAQWSFLYSFLPILMVHSYCVIEATIKNFAIRKDEETDTTDYRVMTGFMLWLLEYWNADDAIEMMDKVIKSHDLDSFKCMVCDTKPNLTRDDAELFWRRGEFKCRSCNTVIDLGNRRMAVPKNFKTMSFLLEKVRARVKSLFSRRTSLD